MAYYARIYYPADGAGDTVFAVPFQYIQQGHVTLYYKTTAQALYTDTLTEGVDYTWTSSAQITLAAPRPNDRDILIRRQTPLPSLATQQAGVISSPKLNLNAKQRQFVDEELFDEMQGVVAGTSGLAARVAALEAVVGIGVGGLNIPASEVLQAGDFVNIHLSSGARLREASALDPLKWASGFVTSDGGVGEELTLSLTGLNTAVNPPTLGEVYLSPTTPGGYTYTAPSAAGSILQPLGLAIPGKGILFTPQPRITLS